VFKIYKNVQTQKRRKKIPIKKQKTLTDTLPKKRYSWQKINMKRCSKSLANRKNHIKVTMRKCISIRMTKKLFKPATIGNAKC
jgi:hypothetical protein